MLKTFTIDQEFVDFVKAEAKLRKANGRTRKQVRLDTQATILEYYNIRDGDWYDPQVWSTDAATPDFGLVEVKRIKDKKFKIPKGKHDIIAQQAKANANFIFFEQVMPFTDQLLMPGDIVQVVIVKIVPADEVMGLFNGSTVETTKDLPVNKGHPTLGLKQAGSLHAYASAIGRNHKYQDNWVLDDRHGASGNRHLINRSTYVKVLN